MKVEDYATVGNAAWMVSVSKPDAKGFTLKEHVKVEAVNPDTGEQLYTPWVRIEEGEVAPSEAKFHFGKLTTTLPPIGIVFLGVTYKCHPE